MQDPSSSSAAPPGMERRLIVAVILTMAVYVAYLQFFGPRRDDAPGPAPAPRPPVPAAPAVPPHAAPVPAPVPVQEPDAVSEAHPLVTARLANAFLDVELTSAGAGIRRVTLCDYYDTAAHRDAREAAYRLVLLDIPAGTPPAGALALDRENAPDLERLNWKLSEEDPAARAVAFSWQDGDTTIEKRFVMPENARHVEIHVTVSGPALWYRLYGPLGLREEALSSRVSGPRGHFGTLTDQGTMHVSSYPVAGKMLDPAPVQGRVVWAGVTIHYFGALLRACGPEGQVMPAFIKEGRLEIRPDPDPVERRRALEAYAHSVRKTVEGLTDGERALALEKVPRTARVGLAAAPHEQSGFSHRYELYLGPKDPQELNVYAHMGYTGVIDYGTYLGGLTRLFLSILRGMYAVAADYGIAIIGLTLIVKLCLFPLNRKNQKAMQRYQLKLQKIQPELDRIKERYKKNRRKMHHEMQRTMSEHGVNPGQMLGGCLLMFLQLPVWIALINVFQVGIELRQAPAFFGLLSDLSLPDRMFAFGAPLPLVGWEHFNLLPVLYVVLTLIQQRLMPKPKDEQARQQQKMMGFMMIAFGAIFYSFASGLLLYFLTSAALGILEQQLIRRELAAESGAAAKP